ncbi:DUF262 domain-containing HNH endonuclease family protein [Mucilaginibacter sabulilitoris]|uniref:DUF262 domain-containing HNH endonuclease family protein n=1 Tax=Mucilaginibacter sabulilitoris TaxID=1173583 RepID=A0ABZ0TTI7_9SPHI|nr:DUF262 domain-containing HNH endonuclease family protein [Mucilaginibacter sabulilitoris]WPU96416.1 DUF262 domain-containing HNH endonuclease family protein [Mucilaginibacter sabulilitoris]
MYFKSTTVSGLFDSTQRHFIIPVYQRAYSWETEQLDVFLNDLKEQIQGGNNYFLGNILLETIIKDVEYEVIDGQQRLTTLMIFFRAMISVLASRQKTEEVDIDLQIKAYIYLKAGGNIKLRPVEYDRACFDAVIIDGKSGFEPATPSQVRIKKAKGHFIKELVKLPTDTLLKLFDKLERTDITAIELQNKKDSALMFELQNNRGKDLTNMERLKSYFMYQMYVYSPEEETNINIEYVSNVFKMIYLIINDLNTLTEDNVLNYHCQAYVKGYSYRKIEDIKEVLLASKDKIKWIKDFINELHTSFTNIKKMERSNLSYLKDLRKLTIPGFVYPFVIKGYKYLGSDEESLNQLYHILEIVVFRYRLINSRADLISRLNEILGAFKGDLEKLRMNFKNKFNDAWYWGDFRIKQYLDGYMYNSRVLSYLLWKYENSIQNRGYHIGSVKITDEQIEHISPQTPTNGDAIESGYDTNADRKYEQPFLDEYLNCLGNLMLISPSHNASIGNDPFSDKVESYNDNPLLKQQAEIKTFVDPSTPFKWDMAAIDRRHVRIVDGFAVKKWDFDSINIGEPVLN